MWKRNQRVVARRPRGPGLLAAGLVAAALATPASGTEPEVSALPTGLEGGFNQDTVRAFTDRNTDVLGPTSAERQVLGLLALIGIELRQALAGETLPDGALVGARQIGLVEAALELGPDGPPPELWRSFFQGSTVSIGRALAPVKRVGLYNAAVDGWVLTDWRQTATGLQLARVIPVAGGADSGTAEDIALPEWTEMAGESVPDALVRGQATALKLFRADNPVLSSEPPSIPVADARGHRLVIESRLGTLRRSLSVLNQPAYLAATRTLLERIDAGDPVQLAALLDGGTTASMHWVTGVLTPLRSQFQPIGVVQNSEGVTVLFGVPQNGRWLLVANYGLEPGANPLSLKSVGFVDLNVAEKWRAEP